MKVETDGECMCPRCDACIPKQFYCLNCGYVPNWRQGARGVRGMSPEYSFLEERSGQPQREDASHYS
jgi:hypothetical protein